MLVHIYAKQKNKTKTLSYRVEDRPANGEIYSPKKYRRLDVFGLVLSVSIKCFKARRLHMKHQISCTFQKFYLRNNTEPVCSSRPQSAEPKADVL